MSHDREPYKGIIDLQACHIFTTKNLYKIIVPDVDSFNYLIDK